MTNEKKWYAVYTKPKWEKKVASLLAAKGVEMYCPLRPVLKQWSDRKKTILEPLFTSYVFVRISKGQYVPTLETQGVVSFVKQCGSPACIQDEEINEVRNFLLNHHSVSVETIGFHLRDKVRITNGAFCSWEGEIKEIRRKTVCVLLPSICCQLVAELDKHCLQKIAG